MPEGGVTLCRAAYSLRPLRKSGRNCLLAGCVWRLLRLAQYLRPPLKSLFLGQDSPGVLYLWTSWLSRECASPIVVWQRVGISHSTVFLLLPG